MMALHQLEAATCTPPSTSRAGKSVGEIAIDTKARPSHAPEAFLVRRMIVKHVHRTSQQNVEARFHVRGKSRSKDSLSSVVG